MKKFSFYLLAAVFIFLTPVSIFAQFDNLSQAEIHVLREKLVLEARNNVGKPYKEGKRGTEEFDEAGFIHYCCQNSLEMVLPATVRGLYDFSKIVSEDERELGDLLFFKMDSSSTMSDIGIYVGSGEFILCTSGVGNSSGVCSFNIKKAPWKESYFATGKLLPASNFDDRYKVASNNSSKAKDKKAKNSSKNVTSKMAEENSENDQDSAESQEPEEESRNLSFLDRLSLSNNLYLDWSLFTEQRFMPNFRGLSLSSIIDYQGDVLTPGLGMELRWNYACGIFQIPFVFSIYSFDFIRFYAGPILSMGSGHTPDTDYKIKPSIFPGILGVSFYFPSFTSGDFKIQIVQDLNYTYFNEESGGVLPILKSLSTGFEFSTGISVTFPLSSLIN